MFFFVFCSIHRRPCLSFPHLIIHPVQEWSRFHWQFWFCFIVSNDKLLWPCSSLRDHNGSHLSITHRFVSFPLLRRPNFVIIPIWVACWERAFSRLFVIIVKHGSWVAAHNGLPRSILSLSFRTPRIMISIASLPRAFWRRGWQIRRSPCNTTHHWSRYRCDSLFSWILLWYFCHRFRTNCRTEMANIEQTQQMIPFVTREVSFG